MTPTARAYAPATRVPIQHKPVAAKPLAAVQLKTRIGPVDDPLEHEADRVADAVVAGSPIGSIAGAAPNVVARKCAACEAEEDHHIHRKAEGQPASTPGPARAAAAAQVLGHGGAPLSARERAYFEPRFGRNLSQVRIHTHGPAAAAAAQIQARAYTLRNDIAFAAGEFSPATLEGRRLIAHELAHVAQQVPHIARQPAPYYTRTFRDDEGGDPLDYTETVQVAPTQGGAGYEGSVDRSVSVPGTGTPPSVVTHRRSVNHIRFTPDCKVVVPLRILFQQAQQAGSPQMCQSPPNATPVPLLPAAQFQNIQTQYITALNTGLNNRFAARIAGCSQQQPCTDKAIPIIIEAQSVANTPDVTINVVNRGGRGDAATICAGSFNTDFILHEGGHQALGAPDEYRESDPNVIASANRAGLRWERRERERGDVSIMASSHDYGRFALFHERHYRFAQAFLEAVMQGQGCSVSLESVASSPWEFRLDLGFGKLSTGDHGRYGSLFIGAAVPLERRRRLNFLFGAQGQTFYDLGVTDQRAFMAGLRLGVEAQTSPANFGVTANLFASGGGFYQAASNPLSSTGLPPTSSRSSLYGEVGGGLSLHTPMFAGGWALRAGIEGAAGREFSNDPNATNWYRFGFTIGVSR